MLIAEHSMCQPGRPGPQGDGHDGSSGSRWLPQHEVERIALAGQVRHVATLLGDRQHRLTRQAESAP